MAVVSLTGTPRQALQQLIVAENPGLGVFPLDQFTLGRPREQFQRRTSLQILGRAGKANEQLMSGNRTVFYNRVDLAHLVQGQHPLPVFGSTTTHGVLLAMAKYWGIVISPEFVVDEPIDTQSGQVTLRFLDDQYLVMQSSVTFAIKWSDTVDIASLWRSTALDGLQLPWPYPKPLRTVWANTELSGLAMPDLVFNMPEHSKRWDVTTPASVEFAASRVVDGPYSPELLASVMREACKSAMPWVCVEHEQTKWNLWASSIVYNGPADGELALAYTHVLRIRPNRTYFHEGTGDISIYYTVE